VKVDYRDGHRVRLGAVDQGDGRIALRGEFDLGNREALQEVLRAAHRRGRGMPVDLSGVTVMDVGCARELAFWRLLGPELLVPVDLSGQASLSFAACGLTQRTSSGASFTRLADEGGATR
jgi:anti-anti-sigma regulatory factor